MDEQPQPSRANGSNRVEGVAPRPEAASEAVTRRSALAFGAAAALGATAASGARPSSGPHQDADPPSVILKGDTIRGALSGRPVLIPRLNEPPMPSIAPGGPVFDGKPAPGFDAASLSSGHPDVCSHRRRFGLLVPATNTTMESELWTILVRNRDRGLDGVGIHTSPVRTPRPDVGSPEAFERFKRDFLGGLADATAMAMLAKPQYLIVGMSLEHLVAGIEPVRATMDRLAEGCDLSWATWHDAAKAALDRFRARRIALITPFDRDGNESASRLFRDLGFEVVASFGFCCANVQHIAHIPDEAKERAVTDLLATAGHRLDAVVQCGTNMSMVAVAERLEPRLGIPVLSINATLLWYALRESGIDARAHGAGRLLREF